MLNSYLQQVRRLVNDQNNEKFNDYDLQPYINEARVQVALKSHCIRIVPQDTVTVAGQEIYPLTYVNLAPFSGVLSPFAVAGVSLVWGTFQFTLRKVSFSRYQAEVRNYTSTYTDVPGICAQLGDSEHGVLYLYPIANAIYSMFWDCRCLPLPLSDDSTPEVIPAAWQPPIKHYAAWMALSTIYKANDEASSVRGNLADRNYKYFEKLMLEARANTTPPTVSNWYGRR